MVKYQNNTNMYSLGERSRRCSPPRNQLTVTRQNITLHDKNFTVSRCRGDMQAYVHTVTEIKYQFYGLLKCLTTGHLYLPESFY